MNAWILPPVSGVVNERFRKIRLIFRVRGRWVIIRPKRSVIPCMHPHGAVHLSL